MNIGSFIHQQCLASQNDKQLFTRLRVRCFRLLRKVILRFADPACQMDIRGNVLWMPLSHQLPLYACPGSNYDKILQRVADFIRTSEGHVCGIDVGANIGDTIRACANGSSQDRFLGIEPNPVFFEFLKKNVAHLPGAQLLQTVCTSADQTANYRIASSQGTAQFKTSNSAEGLAIETKCLDSILEQYVAFKQCNFFKIDTDGYDFEVMRGAKNLISTAKPTVFFECDVFGNPNYFEDTLKALRAFADAGYKHALVYDHLGYLFTQLKLGSAENFPQALFYQVASRRCYFDILVMRDASEFLRQEFDYFINATSNKECRTAAEQAAKQILEKFNQS